MKQDNLKQMYGSTPVSFSNRVAFALNETEEQPMVKKLTIRTALIAAAILVMLMAVAYAAFSSRVTEYFGKLYGKDTQEWLEKGDVATPNQSFTLDGVTYTLDEVVYRNNGLYGMGTIRAAEGSTAVIFPEDHSPREPYGYDVHGASGKAEQAPADAKTYAEVAKDSGGKLLMVRALPDLIGVDGGALLTPESVGTGYVPQRDGSAQYVFELSDGVVVEQGETYTIQMWVSAWEFSPEGEPLTERPKGASWTVEIKPEPIKSEAPQEETAAIFEAPTGEIKVIVPKEYEETGTMPIYRAIERDFAKEIQPEWFNQSGIELRDDWHVVYKDEAILDWAPEALFYNEYNGTFDAAVKYADEMAKEGLAYKPEIVPLGALSDAINGLASWASFGWPQPNLKDEKGNPLPQPPPVIYEIDRTELTNITLTQAQNAFEALLLKLDMTGYVCDYALDMSLERINALGSDMNEMIESGHFHTNVPPYDFTLATAEDEGFYLSYHKAGDSRNSGSSDIFSAYAYVTSRGVVNFSIRDMYIPGEVASTPEKLVDYKTVIEALPKEMAASRFPERLDSILEVRLTYSDTRASNKEEGMVLTPVWLVRYTDEQAAKQGYTCYAEFNAVDGKLLNATFK